MPDQLPEELIEERHARLLEMINRIAAAKYEALVGRTVEILVEGPSRKNAGRFQGRTRSNKLVLFSGSERHRGRLMDLRIERTGSFTLYGDPAVVGMDDATESAVTTEPGLA
jgi:tRNA-2-methylthio-N6-dimethylallyladenosine synthase